MQRRRFSADQWRAWFLEFETSDLTVQQFCDLKGTTANTFYNWRRRLRAMSDAETDASGSENVSATSSFVSVQLSMSQVEFEFVPGVIARVANDAVSLRPIVEVLLEHGSTMEARS